MKKILELFLNNFLLNIWIPGILYLIILLDVFTCECEQAGIVKKDHIKIHGFWAVGVLSVKPYLPDYVLGIIDR